MWLSQPKIRNVFVFLCLFSTCCLLFMMLIYSSYYSSERFTSQKIIGDGMPIQGWCLKPIKSKHIDTSNASNFPSFSSHRHQHHRRRQILHQSWKSSELPPRFAFWSRSWQPGNVGDAGRKASTDGTLAGGACLSSLNWTYRLWTDAENRRLIQNRYPHLLAAYDAFPWKILRVDFVRYAYMHAFGGLYVDLDSECLAQFDHLLAGHEIVFGAMRGQSVGTKLPEGYVQNSFMYAARPGHPFWLYVMYRAATRRADTPETWTGPVMLSKAIDTYRREVCSGGGGGNARRHGIYIHSPEKFNPWSWISKYRKEAPPACKDFNKMSDAEMLNCRRVFRERGAYVVQYHSQSWSKRGRIR